MENEHEGHRARLRKRFRESGLDSFEPHNVLELLLFYAMPRGDTNPLAHRLINEFGSLSGVLEASPEDLMKVPGVGENVATFLTMIPQIARKYMEDKSEVRGNIEGVTAAGDYILSRFLGRSEENVLLVAVDNRNCILASRFIAEGDATSANISKRKVVEEALRMGATKVILAHNHPSGILTPSAEDETCTKTVAKDLAVVGIPLDDHMIVSGSKYLSLRECGISF